VNLVSTKPYLIRAIFEWCVDSGFTPYLSAQVDERCRVPMEYVKNGEIVLNINPSATRNFVVGNDDIQFSARFNGSSRELFIPVDAVLGIFAKENGEGLFFPKSETLPQQEAGDVAPVAPAEPPKRGKPHLQVIK
jgi:stringent starvation protein B